MYYVSKLTICITIFICHSYSFISLIQFSDKLEGMLETLTTTAEQVEKAEPISAHPDKLRDQISDNVGIIEDLDKRLTALESVASTAEDLLNQSGMDDEASKGKSL